MVQVLRSHEDCNTPVWIFICEMDGDEPRFLHDISDFASKLKKKQNDVDSNFYFFVDNINVMKVILQSKGLSTNKVFTVSEFEEKISNLQNIPFLGCVISSHGNLDGAATLKPEKIFTTMNNIKGLTDGLLLLGQCYAGVFNTPRQSKICVIGASNFSPSISSSLPCTTWITNIFLYSFSEWFVTPKDVDGDGNMSLLDGYKYASCLTNQLLQRIKAEKSKTFYEWCTKEVQRIQDMSKQILTLSAKHEDTTELQALYQNAVITLESLLAIYHNTQEPWISDTSIALRLIV